MSIIAKNEGTKRELIPAGSHVARCYSMVHLGTAEEEIQGQKKIRNVVRITWELPEELREFKEGDPMLPMVCSKEYTLSMFSKASLRIDLEGWRGKGFSDEDAKAFEITKLLGKPCMISVIHKTSAGGNDYAVINSISTMPKSMKCPDQINETFEWNFDDQYSDHLLEEFPDFIKDRIKISNEYLAGDAVVNQAPPDDPNDEADDLPF
jgi:hypothetical protein